MNSIAFAKSGYSALSQATRSQNSIEFDVIARVTSELDSANKKRDVDFTSFAAALSKNRRLWTLLAADVASPANKLSQTLKSQIFYLSEFVEKQSKQALKNTQSADALIEINTSLLKGLGQQGARQ